METLIALGILIGFTVLVLIKTAVIVPQRNEYIVERLGKYRTTLQAGFHILIPFIDKVSYRRSLKEEPVDIDAQTCITADNVTLKVDGILYIQVIDTKKSSYGIANYHFAAAQLAQTSLRSAIGKIDLDKTFEARETLNGQVVMALDEAAANWGIKVLRYEIRDIQPPKSVLEAMEKQMKAEREKRAAIATSEGVKQSTINRAAGERGEAIALSEGEKIKRINEAAGRAKEITMVAEATALGIAKVASALQLPGGNEAANLEVAKSYIKAFGEMAKENNTMIVPANLTDVAAMVTTAMATLKQGEGQHSKVGDQSR